MPVIFVDKRDIFRRSVRTNSGKNDKSKNNGRKAFMIVTLAASNLNGIQMSMDNKNKNLWAMFLNYFVFTLN